MQQKYAWTGTTDEFSHRQPRCVDLSMIRLFRREKEACMPQGAALVTGFYPASRSPQWECGEGIEPHPEAHASANASNPIGGHP